MSQWRISQEKQELPSLALSYLTGEESGSRFPLEPGKRHVAGRGSEAQIAVSRKRAEICDASLSGESDITPRETAVRLLLWSKRAFEFNTEDIYEPDPGIDGSLRIGSWRR